MYEDILYQHPDKEAKRLQEWETKIDTMGEFPMQAKFVNTIGATIKNAFALSLIQIPKTLLMIVTYVAPYVLCIFFMQLFPIILLFGISLPVFVSAILYNKMFTSLEDRIRERMTEEGTLKEEAEEEDDVEKIFSDKPIIEGDEH